jgi:hypothetical protein
LRNNPAEEHGMATVIEQIPARSKYLTAAFRTASRHCAPFNVSTREPAAVEYWCRHFDTSPQRLLEAVRRVGSNPDIVRLLIIAPARPSESRARPHVHARCGAFRNKTQFPTYARRTGR